MKDEEMAEEYRKDLKSKFFLSEPQLDLACQGYKDGFLAGLKAGRPQWHDLEKDPKDEPKKDGEYLVQVMCIMFNDVEYCVGRYRKEENRWEGEQVRGLLVTKWKEIE
jgi:hypothetical protein